jgi:hypothetical protein
MNILLNVRCGKEAHAKMKQKQDGLTLHDFIVAFQKTHVIVQEMLDQRQTLTF